MNFIDFYQKKAQINSLPNKMRKGPLKKEPTSSSPLPIFSLKHQKTSPLITLNLIK